MKRWMQWLGIGWLVAAAACQPAATPVIQATQPPREATATPGQTPGELVKFSGKADGVSDLFHLAVESTVEISWQYSGSGQFALWLINESEDLTDPSLARVLIRDTVGNSSEKVQYRLTPGDYYIQVEVADGPWMIQVTSRS